MKILRSGDSSSDLNVRVSTKDGSARSGIHYEPFSKMFQFVAGVTVHEIKVVVINSRSRSHEDLNYNFTGKVTKINVILDFSA